jgi:DNA-binding GntR family transcriptional regulator
VLEIVGMIEARPRRGVRVNGPEPRHVRDGYLIRAELEGLAVSRGHHRGVRARGAR